MKEDFFVVQPDAGTVMQIYVRFGRFLFLHGFCRSAILANGHLRVVNGFRVRFAHDMTARWAERHDFGFLSLKGYALDIVPEEEWMSEFRPEGNR